MRVRRLVVLGACLIALFDHAAHAQVPGPNVNMVSGTTWPGGDPFLQRQNEPSIGVSSRNPLHLLAGANDYRTVDLPGLPDGGATGDAWLGLFKSTSGGAKWFSTMVPGYPQDNSPEGLASPIKGFQAGADPVVRSGPHGLMYYGGLAFNRGGTTAPSAVFIARFVDRNNKENGDPFAYLGTTVVARGSGGQFLDKPTFAAGLPSGSGTCSVQGTQIPASPVYAAWTAFLSDKHPHSGRKEEDEDEEEDEEAGDETRSRIMFARSTNCGVTWSKPIGLSDSRTNQGSTIAVDPRNGHIYVAWRQFETFGKIHAIFVVKSTDGGKSFGWPVPIWGFFPFDQGTTGTSFRTNAYPTMTVDETGRVYVAWSARGYAPMNHNLLSGDARVVMSTSREGFLWTFPRAVDNFPGRGHQVMPALTYAGGKLQLVYYDLREDESGFFEQFVDEFSILHLPPGTPRRRHTLDVRTAQARPGSAPQFASYSVTNPRPSMAASRYLLGSRPGATSGIEQLQFNPPNLPLYASGTVPFIGDYIDIAAQTFTATKNANGVEKWSFNTSGNPVFHLVWTDNRDVVQPGDGDWTNYTPPQTTVVGTPSLFDPTITVQACVPGQGGMRNSNTYTSVVTPGLFAGSPGNAKQLGTSFQRAFVVFAQNTTDELVVYRFSIANQPPGGRASFLQFDLRTEVDVFVAPKSSAARTVYATSTDPQARIAVDIVQIAAGGAADPPAGGRAARVILNPDIANPDIANPDIANPDIANPDIANAEVYNPDIANPDIANPDIANPDIANPDIANPDIANPDIANPDIANPDIANPDIANPDIANPDIANPDIANPDIANGSITDYQYAVTNEGNTAAQFELNLASTGQVAGNVDLQVLVYRQYRTPVLGLDGCSVGLQTRNEIIGNFANPAFTPLGEIGNSNPTDGSVNNITFWLGPGEELKVAIRVLDQDRNDGVTFDPTQQLVVAVVSGAVDTEDVAIGITTPELDIVAPPPVAVNDQFVVANGAIDVPAPGVLANDAAPGARARLVAGPQFAGSFQLNPNGSFSYTPGDGFPGSDSFTYRAAAGDALSGVATVTLTGTAPNNFAGGGVYVDRDSGLIGTSFVFDPTTSTTGTFSIAGPEGWNGNEPMTTGTYSPSGTAENRSLSWQFVPPQNGAYQISTTSANGPIEDTVTIDVEQQLPPPLITQLAFTRSVVTLAWSADAASRSFLIRLNRLPFEGQVIRELVLSGTSTSATLSDLALEPGSYQIGVYAFSRDVVTPDAQLHPFNIGAHARAFTISTPFVVSNTNDAGDGSLRQAILNANETDGTQVISFDIPGPALPKTFTPGSELPAITDPVTIDGTTQPGYSTEPGSPLPIEINGASAGAEASGLVLQAPATVRGLAINRFSLYGIFVDGSSGSVIEGNRLGTSAVGMAALANGLAGIELNNAGGNQVLRNLISGNAGAGLRMSGEGTTQNSIRGNLVGVSANGATDLGNALQGIRLTNGASGNTIGGFDAASRNVISGNGAAGIDILSPSASNIVVGNLIGTDATGMSAIANTFSGVIVAGGNNRIGDAAAGGGNTLAGNGQGGVTLSANATNTTIQANRIGLNIQGAALGNGQGGVMIFDAVHNLIGGPRPEEDNIIAFNVGAGIQISGTAAAENSIVRNQIVGNGGLGIDLGGDGATQNDGPLDPDEGPNRLQNHPSLRTATPSSVTGELQSSAGVFTIRFYLNAPRESGYEGQISIGSVNVTTSANGAGLFGFETSSLLPIGWVVTATATDQAGNTSEFSPGLTVVNP